MFSGKSQVPCVGISFGIDRIFSITKARMAAQKTTEKPRRNDVDIFVMAFGGGKDFTGLLKERSQICARLWDAGIKVGHCPRPILADGISADNSLLQGRVPVQGQAQAPAAVQGGRAKRRAVCPDPRRGKVPLLSSAANICPRRRTLIAHPQTQDELAQGKVRIKEMGLPADHPLKEGELISLDKLEAEAQQRLSLKKQVDSIARQAAGLRVVHGIKGDEVKAASAASGTATTTEQPAAAAAAASEVVEKKPAEGEGGSS